MGASRQTDAELQAELPCLRAILERFEETLAMKKHGSLRENFEAKVDPGQRWTGSVNSDGYPKIKDHGKLRLASHVALELAGRKAPGADQVVMHRDNDPKNMDPGNMRVGTQRQNLKTMRDQGRDRPRGVAQEPDVKIAGVKIWDSFADELARFLDEDPLTRR